MKKTVETDIVIIGGGIAGLWLLNRLRAEGYSVILLESGTLGGEQTNKSQGIIHGGMKYALQGSMTIAANAIADMPKIWKDCLEGNGDLDLSSVPILSENQYLWATKTLASRMAGVLAGFTLKSTVTSLKKESFPYIFQHNQFRGQVYSLDEMVIDANVLIRELMKSHQDAIFKIDPMNEESLILTEDNQLSLRICASPMQPLQVKAQKYIFTAGNGNQLIVKKLKAKEVAMQQRPLHMVVMKKSELPKLFAHCLGMSGTPRITITTHQADDGKTVWYMGGQIAEEGVTKNSGEQIDATKKELQDLFPWLDFSDAEFASFFINRAENKEIDGSRPNSCYMKEIGNFIIAWPTKLAFAPMLSNHIIDTLKNAKIAPSITDLRELRAWPIPALAKPIWDQLLC